jgi:hypothetical protein
VKGSHEERRVILLADGVQLRRGRRITLEIPAGDCIARAGSPSFPMRI